MSRASSVPGWIPPDLPAAPGVYEFQADGGMALYVGKSVNLRRRVRGWFYGGGAALQLPQTYEPGEMVASLIVTGWLLDGTPGGLALDLNGRDEGDRRRSQRRVGGLTPDRVAADAG